MAGAGRDEAWERWRRLGRRLAMPCAVVDLDALERNAKLMLARVVAPATLRLATKSLRVPALMRHLASMDGRIRGLMTFSARETAFLAERGFDDFVLAYPVAQMDEARLLVELGRRGFTVRVVVDSAAHLDLLAAARGRGALGGLSICLDVDVAWRLLDGKVHLGVRRSPVRSADEALVLAERARRLELPVTAVMAYEAQVAGLRDDNPTSRHLDPLRRLVRARGKSIATQRRRAVVDALRSAGVRVEVVNGGGTGSLDSTSGDGTVTEVTAGSGFYAPHLFDGYRGLALAPAAFFLIPIVRFPDPGWVTAAGGGLVASGAMGVDRLPIVHLPRGLEPTEAEGFGEVQTPLKVRKEAPRLELGDPVVCRHAKAGELMERFDTVIFVRGDEVVGHDQTYRGEGAAFG